MGISTFTSKEFVIFCRLSGWLAMYEMGSFPWITRGYHGSWEDRLCHGGVSLSPPIYFATLICNANINPTNHLPEHTMIPSPSLHQNLQYFVISIRIYPLISLWKAPPKPTKTLRACHGALRSPGALCARHRGTLAELFYLVDGSARFSNFDLQVFQPRPMNAQRGKPPTCHVSHGEKMLEIEVKPHRNSMK